MEAKINIAEILKDKPQGTKLYDLLRNIDVELDKVHITDVGSYIVCTATNEAGSTLSFGYSKLGTEKCWIDGLQILFPSKSMQDWSKFAWKKGDVLVSNDSDSHIIFKGFSKNDYTTFEGKHWISVSKKRHISRLDTQNTQNYHIEDNKEVAQTYINTIEERLGGKFNLETLEIEKQPEFKDGDIVVYGKSVAICRKIYKNTLYFYVSIDETFGLLFDDNRVAEEYRLATEEEKLQLFDALAKEGKAWDAEKKAIVDLKPKCEFKPFDRCIWKIRNCEGSIWQASFVSYVDEYGATPMGMSIDEDLVNLIILPYNDQTKLLVGTTDEWKGGEQ
jgi:hypothetical protein|nr:MAG TPA: hypothetical protein [Caudoviricetes sp.]